MESSAVVSGTVDVHDAVEGVQLVEIYANSDKTKKEGLSNVKKKGRKGSSEDEIAHAVARPVPLGFVQTSIQQTLKNRRLMRGLFFYILFTILFVFFFMSRREVEAEYFMTQSLRDLLLGQELPPTSPLTPDQWNTGPYYQKAWGDIAHVEDFYDFVETVLISQLFVSAPDNTLDRRLTGQNIPIGPLRIRAKHVSNRSCSINKYLYPDENNVTVPRVCYGRYDNEVELKDPIGKGNSTWNFTQGCDGWPLNDVTGRYDRYDCSSYNVDMPFNTTLEDALQIAATLRKGDFGNILSLRFLSIEMFTYNPPIDAFASVRMFIEVAMSGAMMPQGRFRPFRIHNPEYPWWSFYYVFFAVVVTAYLVRFIARYRYSIRITGSKSRFFFDVWNLLELANLAAFYVVFGFLFYWWHVSVNIKWTLPYEQVDVFPLDLQSLSEGMILSVYCNGVNTVIVFLKILRYLRLNSRLNILQRTIDAAAQSIVGVLIVFCLVVLAYCLAGHNLYGTGLWEYRTVDESFAQMFRALIGEFDYYAMRDFNRGVTFVYFWSFAILGLFVCLNFLIAVLMNSFDDEHGKVHSLPLHVEIREAFANFKQFIKAPDAPRRLLGLDKTPEDFLEEHLCMYILRLQTEALQERPPQGEGDGDDEEKADVLEEPFYHQDWDKIIPKPELSAIGDKQLKYVWFTVVTEFERTQTMPEEEEQAKEIVETVFEAVTSATARVLVSYQHQLFGEVCAERKKRPKKIRQIVSAHDAPIDEEEELAALYSLHRAKPIPLRRYQPEGKLTNTTTHVADLSLRLRIIEKRFAAAAALLQQTLDRFEGKQNIDIVKIGLPLLPEYEEWSDEDDEETSEEDEEEEEEEEDGDRYDRYIPGNRVMAYVACSDGQKYELPPEGDDWEDVGDDYFWSETLQLCYYPVGGIYYDANTGAWYDPQTDEWFEEDGEAGERKELHRQQCTTRLIAAGRGAPTSL